MNLFNSKDLEKGYKNIDYKIPYTQLEESKMYMGWEEQEQLPDNVIRIETEDGSGEVIEIEFDELKEWERKASGKIEPFFSPLDGVFSIVKKPKNLKNILKKKSKYGTREEVLDVIKNKYGLKSSNELNKAGHKEFKNTKNVYWAKDNKQIKEIWEDITEGAEVLEDKPDEKGGYMIKMRKLNDGTILKLRKKSTSGGSAIDIGNKKPEQTKIHNKEEEDGDW